MLEFIIKFIILFVALNITFWAGHYLGGIAQEGKDSKKKDK